MVTMDLRNKLKVFLSLCAICISAANGQQGFVYNNNLRVENGAGFLVNSLLPTLYPIDSQSIENEQFYIYNQNTATKVTAQFGNLRAEQNITYNLNDFSDTDPLSLKVVNVDGGANITAHLVHTTVTNTKPNLKVLIHSDRKLESARCVRVFAKRSDAETVSDFCILHNGNTDDEEGAAVICMATIPIPYEWWSSRDIDVYFDVQSQDICTTTSNYISRPWYTLPKAAYFIGEAVLMFDDRDGTREIIADANVGLSIPDMPQQAGDRFSVTVKLHPDSTLRLFIIRVELGEGLRLRSVNSSDSKRWAVRVRRSGGIITDIEAAARDGVKPSSKSQEVIECYFEVMKSTVKLEADVKWTIDYNLDQAVEGQFHQQDVLTTIPISKADQIAHLVAVLKTHELVSLRRFTNSVATIPVWLYAIDRSGKISLVNSRSRCDSLTPTILEVSKLCDMIYLSGEGSDPGIVDVVFEYSNLKHTVDVRVWYPDVQMSIKLSDNKLHEIKGWRVRAETNEVGLPDGTLKCGLQYQSSDIRVYTKFYTVHDRRDAYMRGGKVEVFADVTSHVKHLIETSDREIVRYEEGLLQGISPGRATVKVVSAQGTTLADAEIRVASSRTEVMLISGNFVSDINMVVSRSKEEGLLTATYSYDRELSDKLLEGVLELWVHFTDDTVVPLSSFGRQSYKINVETETPTILALPSDDYSSRYIRVRAVGSGRGSLKFTLHMDSACQKKTSKYISVGYVHINSQLSKPAGLFVNDAAYKSDRRMFSVHHKPEEAKNPFLSKKLDFKNDEKPIVINSLPSIQDTGKQGEGMSSLETGMFVLMGVLGVVASVFVTNCLIYTYRQQKRRKAESVGQPGNSDNSEKVDSGWVWLNRNTLEENAISTSPEQLLPERDFQKRCSRSDSLQSTRSKRSSTGTYQGSECSIRITANPRHTLNLPDLSDSEEDELYNAADTCRQPVISIEEPELSEFGEDDEEFSLHSSRSRRRQSADSDNSDECQQSFIVHDDGDPSEPPRPASLTQEQFDNLRESIA